MLSVTLGCYYNLLIGLCHKKSIVNIGRLYIAPSPAHKPNTKTQTDLPTAPQPPCIVFNVFTFTFYHIIPPQPLLPKLFSVEHFTYCPAPPPLPPPLSPRLIVCHHVMSVCHLNCHHVMPSSHVVLSCHYVIYIYTN